MSKARLRCVAVDETAGRAKDRSSPLPEEGEAKTHHGSASAVSSSRVSRCLKKDLKLVLEYLAILGPKNASMSVKYFLLCQI